MLIECVVIGIGLFFSFNSGTIFDITDILLHSSMVEHPNERQKVDCKLVNDTIPIYSNL